MVEDTKIVLNIEDLNCIINETPILRGINLEVKKGEFVGLIGPNGAGKTTLLKCINGINNSQGIIKVKGTSLSSMNNKSIAREIALMHQSTSISFPFPAIDIVLTGRYPHLKRMKRETREDYEIARKYMDYTDTLKFEKRPVNRISGGERQRVLFAKVLTQETDIVLLDEPTASLDIAHEEQIFRYSSELCSTRRTVIAAVHDLKIAARYCTRLVLMKNGEVIADGAPEQVLTSQNLSMAYGVNALVYRNKITGLLDFYIHGMENKNADESVHVIGGGGSASGVIRLLFENGFKISAGVFAHGDSDLSGAEVFGIECISCRPFSEISQDALDDNIYRVRNAHFTILCSMPFGYQNLRNLEAAKHAKKLVIIEDDPPESRDFTGGIALELYCELKQSAVVTTSARLHEII